MGDGLGVDLAAAHVLDGHRDPLSVLDVVRVASDGLQVALLHLAMASPEIKQINYSMDRMGQIFSLDPDHRCPGLGSLVVRTVT